MSLVLALKNRQSIVVASDVDWPSDGMSTYSQFLNLPGRAILLLAGNIEAIRSAITRRVVPQLKPNTGAAVLAQLVHAALVLDVMPHLSEIAGRVEIIVAGIDPVRHTEEPNMYYMDSARDFDLTVVAGDYVVAGATAVAEEILHSQDLVSASTEELTSIAKECIASTKMRWPGALASHQRLGIITFSQIRILDF